MPIKQNLIVIIVLFFPVSQPAVVATFLRFEPGTSITIGCTVVLGPHTDNNEHVAIEWSCPGDSACTGQRYSTTPVSQGHGSDFNANITISPPASQDIGTYMCTGTVTGGNNVIPARASANIIITVTGKQHISLLRTPHAVLILLYYYRYYRYSCS